MPYAPVMPRVNGKPFRCHCECNVFHKEPCVEHGEEYVCNACGQRYEGVPMPAPSQEETNR